MVPTRKIKRNLLNVVKKIFGHIKVSLPDTDLCSVRRLAKMDIITERPQNIYLAEPLSPECKNLFAAARHMRKVLNYASVWVKYGRVYMRNDVCYSSQRPKLPAYTTTYISPSSILKRTPVHQSEGGGVLVAIKRHTLVSRNLAWDSSVENICVSIQAAKVIKSSMNLCAFYMPPDTDSRC